MIFNKTIQMTFLKLNEFAEPVAAQAFRPVCAMLSYGRAKEATQNGHTVNYRLKIAMPYRRIPPYSMIREDSLLSFVHEGITFEVQQIETIMNGLGRPTKFIFDLLNAQEVP